MRPTLVFPRLGALLAGVAAGLALSTVEAAPAPRTEAVESTIRDEIGAGKLASLTFALVQDGRILREGGFGMADPERHLAATAHTPYPLASLTKPLVATATMSLVERGKIDLEAPAARYLPEAGQDVPGNIRQLLGHTSGLTTYVRIGWGGNSPGVPDAGADPWPYAFAAQPPGTLFEYANLGYGLLGRIVEARSGQSLGGFLRSDLFVPLGMHDSSLPGRFQVPARAARKLDATGKPLPPTWNDTPGAGNAYASAHDLALFAAFSMSSAPSKVLGPDNRRLMREHVEPGARHDYYAGAHYGLGWYFRDEPSGERVVWHEGGMPGASSIVYMLPGRNLAVAVLINQTDANEAAQRFALALVHAVEPRFTGTPLVATQGFERYAGAEDLRGRWSGLIHVAGSLAPWSLTFRDDGLLEAELPASPGVAPRKETFRAQVHEGLVLGAFEGGLSGDGETAGPGRYVLLRLLRQGDQITGALVAYSSEERLEYLRPYAVSLRRESR